MNHILKLTTERDNALTEIAAKAEAIQNFRVHLSTDKFSGTESDGSRKDWIAIADIHRWLNSISEAGS